MIQNDRNDIEDDDVLTRTRSRIFNSELNNLIRKVSEKTEVSIQNDREYSEQETDLLRRFHELFYRAKNIPWYDAEASFVHAKQADKIMSFSEIDSLLRERGCLGFALLCYDVKMKGFCPTVNTIMFKNQLCIGLHDPLLTQIGASLNGLSIYDEKMAGTMDVPKGYEIFMLSGIEQVQEHPSEIFLALCKNGTNTDKLAAFIRLELSESLRVHGKLSFTNYTPFCGEKFESIAEKIEIFFRMAMNYGAETLALVGVVKEDKSKDVIADSILMLSLIYARLINELNKEAFFIRLHSDCFFVLVKPEAEGRLREVLHKSASSEEGLFYIEEHALEHPSSFAQAYFRLLLA